MNHSPNATGSGESKESREILFFPEPPTRPDGRPAPQSPKLGYWGRYYLVICETEIVAAYNPSYFPSTKEVVSDLLMRIGNGEIDIMGDFAVWGHGRLMAVSHQKMNSQICDMTIFGDPRNDIAFAGTGYFPGWPTRKQWVESGKGPLWYDRDNPKNPDDGEYRIFDEDGEPHILGG